jgi:hypothetical protein
MPTPSKGEKQKDFVSRCIPIVIKDGTAKDPSQAVAICNNMFKSSKKKKLSTYEMECKKFNVKPYDGCKP